MKTLIGLYRTIRWRLFEQERYYTSQNVLLFRKYLRLQHERDDIYKEMLRYRDVVRLNNLSIIR